MKSRKKQIQHVRRYKSGKKTTINPGVKKRLRSYNSKLFNDYLISNNLVIDGRIPKSQQKILRESLRKHADLLNLTNKKPTIITTSSLPNEFGTVMSHNVNGVVKGPVTVSISDSHFRKKGFFEGRSNLPKTLAHEFKHVEQRYNNDQRSEKELEKEAKQFGLNYGGK